MKTIAKRVHVLENSWCILSNVLIHEIDACYIFF